MMYRLIAPGIVAAALVLGLAGCTNPYDPGQRAVGGGLLGAGAGQPLVVRWAADTAPLLAQQSGAPPAP
jgi:hypothetical protein